MPSILSVGNDAALTKTRGAVLATAIPASVIVADPPAALLLLRDQNFDLVVLCHTVSTDQAAILLQAARCQSPSARTLIVDPLFSGALSTTSTGERRGPSADPAVLVARARQLLTQPVDHSLSELRVPADTTNPHLPARDPLTTRSI